MMSNMAASLILHKRINTTLAKAKALRTYVEPLITKSKEDTTHSRRTVFAYLKNKFAVSELFREVSVKVADRPGGYTRIIKTGNRLGDNAEMAMIELVDYNDVYVKDSKGSKGAAKKSRRGGKKKSTEAVASAPAAKAAVVEAPSPAEPEVENTAAPQVESAADDTTAEVQQESPSTESESSEEEKKD